MRKLELTKGLDLFKLVDSEATDSDDDIPLAPTEQLDIRITWDWTDFMYSDPDNEYDLTDSTGGSL